VLEQQRKPTGDHDDHQERERHATIETTAPGTRAARLAAIGGPSSPVLALRLGTLKLWSRGAHARSGCRDRAYIIPANLPRHAPLRRWYGRREDRERAVLSGAVAASRIVVGKQVSPRLRWTFLATLVASLLTPASASAHGIVGRADLPIPAWLFAWTATAVMVISFVALWSLWSKPRLQRPPGRVRLRVPKLLEWSCGGIGISLFAIVAYAGLAGE
jgi:hypothetical protein